MAEGLVTDLIKQLLSVAAREAEQEIRLVIGVNEEIEKLKGNLRTVKAVLNDAEKRQVTEEAVKVWLEKLNNACYKMEDVVDEWNTSMIKSAIQKKEENVDDAPVLKKKVCSFIPSPSYCFCQVDKLVLRHDIAHKIKELNGILDEITKEKDRYQFQLTNDPTTKVLERPQTTSFVDMSEICGRDNIKDDLLSMLLGTGSEEETSPHVVSLVGMGGIGKTALAQLAYNDPKVQAHFEKKMWVCVSDPFDQCKVAKEIIESVTNKSPKINALQSLLKKICALIRGKKFFLILDDVWTEDYKMWEPFKLALKCDVQGSRILVTTRKSRVAEMMGSASTINLEVLSKEDCWLVFSKIAFFDWDPNQSEQLEDLGRQIVDKCKGLPLAAKTLGSLMHFKRSREEWKCILDSNLWELEDVEQSLFAPLLLSYYDLSSPLKRCFTFCAIFPKGYFFSINELVFMWMAQGYIIPKANMEIEIMARDYFENLVIRSFFQDFEKDKDDGKIRMYKMHDIVHDFAQLMSKNECFTINNDIELGSNYKNYRHLQLKIPTKAQFPKSIYSAKSLRTLIFAYSGDCNLSTLFRHFRCLRILILNCKSGFILKELPVEVENFIHLRYLEIVNYCGDRLPETICNLCNLQILKIASTNYVPKLPQGMGKLINLRHFILKFSYFVSNVEFPRGFGRLTSLRTLNYFSVSGKDHSERCRLGELRNLNHLQGTLEIYGLGSEVNACEAENAQLKKKIGLCTLLLWFDERVRGEIIREMDVLVLNALEPPPNLEDLTIGRYQGLTMFPNWMLSLTKLKKLDIYALNLECLPPLGKLPLLNSLRIKSNYLKNVGDEFLGIKPKTKKEDNMITVFPNLKSLTFDFLGEWEEWVGIGGEEEKEEDCIITIIPSLQKLEIFDCPKLKSLPNFLHTIPLQKLEIRYNSILSERCRRGRGKDWSKVSHIPNIICNFQTLQKDGQEFNPQEACESIETCFPK